MNKIEQVARAIYEAWAKEKKATEHTWSYIVEVVQSTTNGEASSVHEIYKLAFLEALAAIEAMRGPTEGMVEAYWKRAWEGAIGDSVDSLLGADEALSAMIDAALEGK